MTACSSNFLALAAEALLVKRCVGRYLAPGSEEEEEEEEETRLRPSGVL